ncbi:MAG TPA: YncE family protein [Candidatus Dormibacteraeota bacterium]|nr:YncE family protein [Candidatus Dormibacteraeota bacterium]
MRAGRWASWGASVGVVAASVLSAAAGTVLLSACGSCDSIVRQSALPVLAAGSFDGVAADQSGHRLYFADQSIKAVDVVDVSGSSPRFMGSVDLPGSPNGLAVAPGLHRLYAGMDGGQVAVIDTDGTSQSFMQVIDNVTVDAAQTSPTADLMDYSASTKSLYVGTGSSGSVVVMDATTDKVTRTFPLNTPVEQPRFDAADGKLYVTTPHTDALLRVDPSNGKVLRTLTQKSCRPSGLAINPSRQIAMVACRGTMALFDLRTGLDQISRSVPGGDIVSYDSSADRFTVGSSHGPRDSSVGVYTGDARFVGMVASSPEAHGAVFDDRTGLLYAVSKAGLLSFSPAACAPPPDWLTFTGGAAVFFVPMALFGLFLISYARRRSQIASSGKRPPTWDELQREDLASERARIRDLEDAIYGPLENP